MKTANYCYLHGTLG